jgi:predicted SnoaL-like aldol condensation-catalyzing enzyme
MKITRVMAVAAVVLLSGVTHAQSPVQPARDQLGLLESADPILAKNKRLVFDYFREVLEAGRPELLSRYLAKDFIQHDPNMTGDEKSFAALIKSREPTPRPAESRLRSPLVTIVAERDLVVMVFLKTLPVPGAETKVYTTTSNEIYRIERGKIKEHWATVLKE